MANLKFNNQKNGVFCKTEIDGLRIITTEEHSFLEKVH